MSDANTQIIELAKIMGVDIDSTTLNLCIRLIDEGVDPQELARCIVQIKRETQI